MMLDSWKGQASSLLKNNQIGSGAHPASSSKVTEALSREFNWPRCEADH